MKYVFDFRRNMTVSRIRVSSAKPRVAPELTAVIVARFFPKNRVQVLCSDSSHLFYDDNMMGYHMEISAIADFIFPGSIPIRDADVADINENIAVRLDHAVKFSAYLSQPIVVLL